MPIYNDLIPIFGKYLKSNSFLEKLSPEEREKIQKEYRDKIKIGDEVNFSSNAFKTFEQSRITNIQGFSKTLGPDGKPLLKSIQTNTTVKSEIENALTPSDAYKQGKAEFEESIATFKDLVKQIPEKFSVEDLIDTMKDIKDDAVKTIEAQQKQEIEALEKLFENAEFTKQLTETFSSKAKKPDISGTNNADSKAETAAKDKEPAEAKAAATDEAAAKKDLELIKANLKADLQASHTKQLEDFKKSTADSMNQLQKSSALEKKQIEFITLLAKLHNDNSVLLQQKALEADKASGMAITVSPDKVRFTGALLKNLEQFKTITGKDVIQNPPGTYTIEMSRNIFSPLYYLDPRQSLQADYRLMVKACMADGIENLSWTFDYEDQDSVMAHAREAFQASIEEGADPAKIKMKDGSGREIKPEEAFKDQPKVLKQLYKRSAEVRQELTNQKQPTATNQAAVKKEIQELRAQNKAAKEVTYDVNHLPQTPGMS